MADFVHISELCDWTPELAEEIAGIKVIPPRPDDVFFFFSVPQKWKYWPECAEGAD